MSSDQAQNNGITDDAQGASHANTPSAESSGGGSHILLFFILGLALSMVVGWVIFPQLLYTEKNQPFDFNHQLHLEQVGDCTGCHFFRADGSFSGSPGLAQCVDCHSEPMGESEDEAVFVTQYVYKEREVPWRVYARQPDCVFFSHAAHTFGAKLECKTCHGDMGNADTLRPYEENRITGYSRDIWGRNISGFKRHIWDRMKMDDCAECHERNGMHDSSVQTGRDACFVCHK